MTADGTVQTADLVDPATERWAAAPRGREYKLWAALACASVLHAALIIGFVRQAPRYIGDPEGSTEVVTVSLITDADFKSKSTVPARVSPPPAAPAAMPTPPPMPEAERQPPPEPAPEPPTPPEPEVKQEQSAVPPPPEPKADNQKQSALPQSLDANLPDLFSLPDAKSLQKSPAKKAEPQKERETQPAKKTPPAKKKSRRSKLDLSMPRSFSSPGSAGGGAAAFARPPGITRSGANDEFARGVIRALQETMPQLRNTLGRVTIRILLNENGNIERVSLVRSSEDSRLDQSVIFAAKQTSYPLPPGNSNVADRTFLITYIYE